MKRILVFLSSVLLFLSGAFSGETISGDLGLWLDLGKGSYTFGLSTNPITSNTSEPNDLQEVRMQAVDSTDGVIGIIGDIAGNPYNNELHFYWDVTSSYDFKVLLCVPEKMTKVGDSDIELDWTLTVGDPENASETIKTSTDPASKTLTIYEHNAAESRHDYSSVELKAFTDPAVYVGTYNGTLQFRIES